VQDNRWQGRAPVIGALALLAIALLFFFEWLGSEQPQNWVESPIDVPVQKDQAKKPRQ
jgi:hypothetical protein